ncbi:MAG: chromate transporter [Oscillospiraceae bacterium]
MVGRGGSLYLELFLVFAKIGVLTFGGGYAMLPFLQREVVEKRGWATDEELMDYYAIGQCTPGIIAVNTATLIGQKKKGALGGIIATLGVVFPSLIIIIAIAAFFSNFADIAAVKDAFISIRACVCVLILNAVIKLFKSSVIDLPSLLIFAAVFACALIFDISPAIFIVAAAVAGIFIGNVKEQRKK